MIILVGVLLHLTVKMKSLIPTQSFTIAHTNGNHFAVVHDLNAGKSGTYTVFVWRVGKKAKIIGREINLSLASKIIEYYPKKVPKEVLHV